MPAARVPRVRQVIGLNSGTSLGSLDLAWVRCEGGAARPRLELVEHREAPFSAELEARLQRLARGEGSVREVAEAERLYGEAAAEGLLEALAAWRLDAREVHVVGCHGQTIYHHCGAEPHATLQVGSGAFLAERTGIRVACDFRTRDLAAGGEGAPLSPLLDEVLFARERLPQLVVNLGGISNASLVRRGLPALGFDGGPANVQLDLALRWATAGAERIDLGGARAVRGRVDEALLAALEERFASWLSPLAPRSSGREEFGERALLPLLESFGRARLDDALATLARFAARCFARRLRRYAPELFDGRARPRVWWTGGGARHAALVGELERELAPWTCAPLDAWSGAAGRPLQSAREALLFALLADRRVAAVPSDLRSATGALRPVVLGCLWS
ncbi:MAG: anhydro-N-acetylmuramic acid kinase [Planctomycetes bacterium]|nr:anhydro-N-acetylmuramic acid kinase [Planctomycetota bacterium]